MGDLYRWVIYFFVYSVLGWLIESVYCSILARKWVERGFLNGPLCPIYGSGAVAVLWALEPFSDSLFHVFVLGTAITTVLEYVTSYVMEKLFHMRWWDYSQFRFHIHGRVCLVNSLLFGVMCVLLEWCLHPWVKSLVSRIPLSILPLICLVLGVYLAMDTFLSARTAWHLSRRMKHLKQLEEELRQRLREELEERREEAERKAAAFRDERARKKMEWERKLVQSKADMEERMDQQREKARQAADHIRARIAALQSTPGLGERRLMRAFPHMRSRSYEEVLERLRKEWEKREKNKQG